MPSIIRNVKIVEIESVVHYGDAIQLSPLNSSKQSAGAGSFITGDLISTNNAVNATRTNDPDASDLALNTIGNQENRQ
ncbi:spore germination protein [Cohnella sp.]|uniref:spore germination protein n=1 Tax=Cohnella sp. TaxID=1883426 RepID=UPI0035637196